MSTEKETNATKIRRQRYYTKVKQKKREDLDKMARLEQEERLREMRRERDSKKKRKNEELNYKER